MPVAVMDIGIMRMRVLEHPMLVRMHMRLHPIPVEIVQMLMMRIVAVRMAVRQRFVDVFVAMCFRQVQPQSGAH